MRKEIFGFHRSFAMTLYAAELFGVAGLAGIIASRFAYEIFNLDSSILLPFIVPWMYFLFLSIAYLAPFILIFGIVYAYAIGKARRRLSPIQRERIGVLSMFKRYVFNSRRRDMGIFISSSALIATLGGLSLICIATNLAGFAYKPHGLTGLAFPIQGIKDANGIARILLPFAALFIFFHLKRAPLKIVAVAAFLLLSYLLGYKLAVAICD